MEQLHATCLDSNINNANDGQPTETDVEPEPNEPSKPELHPLLEQPTLYQLAASRRVRLVFCPELVHLRAYLSTLAIPTSQSASTHTTKDSAKRNEARTSSLVLLNPIDLHRNTSSFSAQGLNRTFALAVEAAHATQTQLLMAEFSSFGPRNTQAFDAGYDFEFEPETTVPPQSPPAADLWDEEVSILNVTTKSFGAGGRGWVGRTVTVRRVAERWCVFTPFRHVESFV